MGYDGMRMGLEMEMEMRSRCYGKKRGGECAVITQHGSDLNAI